MVVFVSVLRLFHILAPWYEKDLCSIFLNLSMFWFIRVYLNSYLLSLIFEGGSRSFKYSSALPCLDLKTVIAKSCRYGSLTFFQANVSNKEADGVHSSEPVIIRAALSCILRKVSPQLLHTEIS